MSAEGVVNRLRIADGGFRIGGAGFVLLLISACLTAGLDAQTWTKVPGCARDIGVGRDAMTGRDGIVWIVGCTEVGPGGCLDHPSGLVSRS